MNKTLARKWVKALRSGEYKQTTNMLKNTTDGSLCCLGVLCDISGRGTWDGNFYTVEGSKSNSNVPINLREEIKLPKLAESTFINLNDVKRYSFSKIAAYIEDKYKLNSTVAQKNTAKKMLKAWKNGASKVSLEKEFLSKENAKGSAFNRFIKNHLGEEALSV